MLSIVDCQHGGDKGLANTDMPCREPKKMNIIFIHGQYTNMDDIFSRELVHWGKRMDKRKKR